VIDGAMPSELRRRLVNMTRDAMARQDMRGLINPKIVEGKIGGNARAIGAATGPIISRFLLDRSAALIEYG